MSPYFPCLYLTLSYSETKENNKEETKLVTKKIKPIFFTRETPGYALFF
jgi:hypothetical protein